MSAQALRRNLWLFHVYRFLSTSYLFIPVLYLQSRGLTNTQIGLLGTVYCVTVMFFEAPTGALADHFGRRKAMAVGSLLMALGCVIDYLGRSFWTFAAGDGFLALGMTLTSGADSAYLFDLLRSAGRDQEYRRLEGSASAAKLIGTALALIAGGVIGHYDLALPYALSAGICLISVVVALLLSEAPRGSGEGQAQWLVPLIRSAVNEVRRVRRLRYAIGFSILVFCLLREGMYLYPIYLKQAHFDVRMTGTMLALLSLVSAWAAYRIEDLQSWIGERALLIALPLVMAVTYLAMGRWFAGWGLSLLVLQMLVNGIYSPLSKDLLNREIPDSRQRATVLSMESISRRLAFGIASPLVGLFLDRVSVPMGFYACGFMGVCGLALLYRQRGHLLFASPRAAALVPVRQQGVITQADGR